jgi:drug/metabolite transporter (DMT)-like permease
MQRLRENRRGRGREGPSPWLFSIRNQPSRPLALTAGSSADARCPDSSKTGNGDGLAMDRREGIGSAGAAERAARGRLAPIVQALLAALLFGVSAPVSKLLLDDVEAVPMVAFLYLGSGAGLFLVSLLRTRSTRHLARRDLLTIGAMILFGGVLAPLSLMLSLPVTAAATAALLLNFESVSTTVLARFAFGEHVSRRIWFGVGAITVAAIVLSLDMSGGWGISLGALGIILACVFWGFDNNFSRKVSGRDPVDVVALKSLGAALFSLCLVLALGSAVPSAGLIAGVLVFGFLCYGLSAYLLVLAMRSLGAARAVGYFAAAPFIGSLFSFLLFAQWPGITFLLSFPLMAMGAFLLSTDRHGHIHVHEGLVHEHPHVHDAHHLHGHPRGDGTGNPHTHVHVHEGLSHDHEHDPDIHHRHSHG